MFGADGLMTEASGFIDRESEDLLRPGTPVHLPADRAVATSQDPLDRFPRLRQLHAHAVKDLGCRPAVLAQESEQQMLRSHSRVVKSSRLVLGERENISSTVRQPVMFWNHAPSCQSALILAVSDRSNRRMNLG